MPMDRKLRDEVIAAVLRAEQEAHEFYEERWITGEQLIQQFQMFTKDWLRRYGHSLPRVRATVTDEQGIEHQTGWAYPRNEIQRMIREGRIEHLRCLCVNMVQKAEAGVKL